MNPDFDASVPESIDDFNTLQEFVRNGSPGEWLGYAQELNDNTELIWSHEDENLRAGVVTKRRILRGE
jgi:hypothetical protein